jgi:heme-degrading monooxygenase HmoA
MILEHAVINVTPGTESSFETDFAEAKSVLASCPGCLRIQMHKGVEHPSRYLLLVEWETIDDHLVGFRQSQSFTKWRALIGPHFDGSPEVDHYEVLSSIRPDDSHDS